MKGGHIKIKRTKGCYGVDIPISPELGAAIDATPTTDHLTYLITRKGRLARGARPQICRMAYRGRSGAAVVVHPACRTP
jgi:hypothetical protein